MKQEVVVYKVKPNNESWYIGNTFAFLITDFRPDMNSGDFIGTKMCENPSSEGNHKYGEIYFDGEVCGFDEFEDEPYGTAVIEVKDGWWNKNGK